MNLDRHKIRRAHIEAQLAGANISAERVPGVDGRNLPPEISDNFAFATQLSSGQIGCYASHLRIMQIMLRRDISAALVLEDDAILPSDLTSLITGTMAALPPAWDIVRLCRQSRRSVRPIAPVSGNFHIVQYWRIPLGSAGYLVSRGGASKLLRPRHIAIPIDVDIARPWELNLNVYGITPAPIRQARDTLPTTIRGNIRLPRSRFLNACRAADNFRRLGPYWWARCLMQNAITRIKPIDSAPFNFADRSELCCGRAMRMNDHQIHNEHEKLSRHVSSRSLDASDAVNAKHGRPH